MITHKINKKWIINAHCRVHVIEWSHRKGMKVLGYKGGGGREVGGGGFVGIARCLNLLPLKFDIHCIHGSTCTRNIKF